MQQIFNAERLRQLEQKLFQHNPNSIAKMMVHKKIWSMNPYTQEKVALFSFPFHECLYVFPDEWIFNKAKDPVWVKDPNKDTFTSAMDFFGINSQMTLHLFSAQRQLPLVYGGRKLRQRAEAHEIAYNIFELTNFIKQLTNPYIHSLTSN